MQATYLRYVDSADHVRTLTEQLHDASIHRAELEASLQDAKLERARAVREKEEAALATSEVADEAEGLKLELEARMKEEEDRLAAIAALEAEIKSRDEEIQRLQMFVNKTQVMEVEAESLRIKVSRFSWSHKLRVCSMSDHSCASLCILSFKEGT
jgi:chromosome segregation ATPase